MRRFHGVLIILLSLLLMAAHSHASVTFPILVDGNEALAQWPGVTGTGTEDDPYVISALDSRTPSDQPILTLRNINAHTILSNCTFKNVESSAVVLEGCSNLWILDSVFANNSTAISATPDCREVIIALCTFERNGRDIAASAASIALDDGYVGNWWDRNVPLDLDGDGLSEIPFLVQTGSPPLVDKRSLVFKYAGDRSDQPEGVRLEIRYSAGETFRLESTTQTTMIITHSSEVENQTELSQTFLCHMDVASAPGTGYAELQVEVIEDTGTVTMDGKAYPSEGVLGLTWAMGSHRFGGGAMALPSLGEDSGDVLPGPIRTSYAFYPLRPILPGYRWSSVEHLEPSSFGLTEGDVVMESALHFARVAELNGEQFAVIESDSLIYIDGSVLNEVAGTIQLSGTTNSQTRIWVSLATGQTLRADFTVTSLMDSSLDGELFMTIKQSMAGTTQLSPAPE